MVIHVATDHAGFEQKNSVVAWLLSEGYKVIDHGACVFNEEDDFPDFISLVAAEVSAKPQQTRGIIFGGSGQGEAILANRYINVRAVVYYGGNENIPILSREHNDSNILSIGARFVDEGQIKKAIWDWLHTEVSPDEKYHRRNKKIEAITKKIQA